MHSVSATYDDAVNKYAWYTFDGPRGREVTQRSHKRMIKNGDVFGLVASKTGSRYTLIFPDMPHIDFPVDKASANFLIDRSKKMRKTPDNLVQRQGREKAAGVVTMERQLARRQFDTPRYAPRKTPVESAHGVDFSNYQWRIIEQPYKIKHSKGTEQFVQNDVVGVRFLRESKGGIVINQEGMYLKVPTDEYDRFVADSKVLAFPDWPTGTLTAEEVKSYRRELRRSKQASAVEKAAAARLARRADRIALQLEQRELRRADRKARQEEELRMADMRQKVRSGEMAAPGPKPVEDLHPVFKADIRRGVRRILREERMLEDDELELNEVLRDDESPEQEEMSNVLVTNPFGADSLSIEETIGKLFGRDEEQDDSVDNDDGAFDLSDIDEPEDDEEPPAPKSKVRKKGTPPVAAAPDATEEDDDNPDDQEDDEDNQDEESDEDFEEDGDEDADDADADDSDESDTESDEEQDEEADSDDEADDSDSDASDAVDESDSSDEEDPDVAAADDEASRTPQDYAKQNANPVGSKASEAEEGDIVKFKADAKLNRDWVILRVSTHSTSDNIVVYTVFDITNSPDEVRQVRINRARKQNLFDYCEHVKDMTPKLFNRVFDMAEEYPVNKEPIAS